MLFSNRGIDFYLIYSMMFINKVIFIMGNNFNEYCFKCGSNILLYGVVIVDIKNNIIYVISYYCDVFK